MPKLPAYHRIRFVHQKTEDVRKRFSRVNRIIHDSTQPTSGIDKTPMKQEQSGTIDELIVLLYISNFNVLLLDLEKYLG